MKSLLFTRIIFLYASVFEHKAEKNEALVFDRFTHSLFYIPRDIPQNAECGAWAVACPSETLSGANFNRRESITKEALFVRKIHRKGSKMSDVVRTICEQHSQVSLTYHVQNSTLQLGFEVYYELDQAKYFHENHFENYRSTSKLSEAMKIASSRKTKNIEQEITSILENSSSNDIKELWLDEDQRLGFAWLKLVEFKFDFSKKIVKQATYNIGPNSKWPVLEEQCENYRLGSELYEGVEVNSLYSWDKRTEFADSKKPSYKCQSNASCFKKLLIVPMDQFRSGSSQPLCSNLLAIPVWQDSNSKPIEYFLKKVDQYLYVLYRIIGVPLRIIAGISGEHEFQIKKRWSKWKSTIYLDSIRKRIPIPKIIYKIVEYRLKNCEIEEKFCWYSIIIVIHNDPFFDPQDYKVRICSDSYTNSYDWQEMLKDENGNKHGFIYICPRNENTEIRLTGAKSRYVPENNEIIDLEAFPVSNDGRRIFLRNALKRVNRKIEDFIKNGEDLEHETKNMIELAKENYSNPYIHAPLESDASTDDEDYLQAKPVDLKLSHENVNRFDFYRVNDRRDQQYAQEITDTDGERS